MKLLEFSLLYIVSTATINELGISEIQNDGELEPPVSLMEDGVFVLRDVLDVRRMQSLAAGWIKCAKSHKLDGRTVQTTRNPDSSERWTLASSVHEHFEGCDEETNENIAYYKSRTQYIGDVVAEYLDKLLSNTRSTGLIQSISSNPSSESIDHFHVYSAGEERVLEDEVDAEALSVPYHYDMGLFLILTPELWIGRDQKAASSLLVKGSDGSITRVEPSNKSSSVIIMIGKGLTSWLVPKSPFSACLHAVEPIERAEGVKRIVLARMFLPPSDAVSSGGVVFSDFFHSPLKPSVDADAVAVKWRRLSETRCAAGKKFCWMMCLEEPDCGGEESVCMHSETRQECMPSQCDRKCGLMCPVKTFFSSVHDDSSMFCQGATSMVMSGFESVTESDAQCIILFFKSWLLDSWVKFAFGCLGVFLLGMTIEATIKLRRFVTSSFKAQRLWVKEAVVTTLFGTNVALGYLAMLAAMTFNVEIFISTVLGLAIGHLVFANSKEPVRETADPCCVTSENLTQVTTSLRNSTGACCCNLDS